MSVPILCHTGGGGNRTRRESVFTVQYRLGDLITKTSRDIKVLGKSPKVKEFGRSTRICTRISLIISQLLIILLCYAIRRFPLG